MLLIKCNASCFRQQGNIANELGVGSRQSDWKVFLYFILFYLPHTVIKKKYIYIYIKVEKRSGKET